MESVRVLVSMPYPWLVKLGSLGVGPLPGLLGLLRGLSENVNKVPGCMPDTQCMLSKYYFY